MPSACLPSAPTMPAKPVMKSCAAPAIAACLSLGACATLPQHSTALGARHASTLEDMQAVSPGLARYTTDTVHGGLWARPQLSPRDRSVVTLAVLIARNQSIDLPYQLDLALDNGVTPGEISEIITHLAFYCGWGNATAAVTAAKIVFAQRGVGPAQLPPARPVLLPLDLESEARRQAAVMQSVGATAPGVVEYTTDVLFHDLWLRPGLAPRDRSLVTVSALVANGQVAQLNYHLIRALDNGLTQEQASEAMTQMAFYAGWPSVFSALPAVKQVFAQHPH